jgi:NAD(P)H dehydrogenase (quinone)
MDQPKMSVIYHGASGALQALAKEVAAGAEEKGAVVRIRRVPDHAVPGDGGSEGLARPHDVRWADAVVLGSPSRYGNLAPPLKSYVDTLESVEGEGLRRIVWSGFVTDDGVLHGGHEATLMTLFHALFHLGGVVVPPLRAGNQDVRTLARRTGRDVADVAHRLLVGAAAEIKEESASRRPIVTDPRGVLS